MKRQAFNPFLPSYEYIPDGEPYVFGGRLYLYGSHDCFDGKAYCLNDYVCWSAPVGDLGEWRYEGVIYKKTQDPMNADGKRCLYAPDIKRGLDGRFYLYYAFDSTGIMSVAVCDTPAGEYQFYGYVKRPNGTIIGASLDDLYQFDPGVLVDDDGRIYLYSGFAPEPKSIPHFSKGRPASSFGSFVMELEPDMLTIKSEPKPLLPTVGNSEGTGFEGHEHFEASSIRKINGKYYLVYSTINSHELCYAVSDRPDSGYVFGGTLVSIGDVYLNGRKLEDSLNYLGNTHGGIVEVNGQWYVFYHRQTNLHQFSRQACAEKIYFEPDGSIKQAEITSCGLNNGPLLGKGVYEARIACNLLSKEGTTFYPYNKRLEAGIHPYLTQGGTDREVNDKEIDSQYIANFSDGATAGFKYFDFKDTQSVSVKIRGEVEGIMNVSTEIGGTPIAKIKINAPHGWQEFSAPLDIPDGIHAIYFIYEGEGSFDFMSFEFR